MNQLENTAQLFKTLSEPVRLRILNLLMHTENEICVCDLIRILEVPQSVISRHLAYLRKADLVRARRDGVWMHYSMNGEISPVSVKVLQVLKTYSETDESLAVEAAKLSACGC